MFMTAPLCILVGFIAGKRQGAKSIKDDGKYICLDGLSPKSVDLVKGYCKSKHIADQAKRNRLANWMYKRKVWTD